MDSSTLNDEPSAVVPHSAIVGDDNNCSVELEIKNKLGLHARPSARFVKIASSYQAEIWVEKAGEQINGKSIMGLMMIAAGLGSKLKLVAEGPDAKQALLELEALIENKFEED